MKRLSSTEIAVELSNFLDSEGNGGEPETADQSYYYERGAIEFAAHLKAACADSFVP